MLFFVSRWQLGTGKTLLKEQETIYRELEYVYDVHARYWTANGECKR